MWCLAARKWRAVWVRRKGICTRPAGGVHSTAWYVRSTRRTQDGTALAFTKVAIEQLRPLHRRSPTTVTCFTPLSLSVPYHDWRACTLAREMYPGPLPFYLSIMYPTRLKCVHSRRGKYFEQRASWDSTRAGQRTTCDWGHTRC